MKLRVIAVGRVREKHVRQAIDDYRERIKHYVGLDEVEISDGSDDEVAERTKKAAKEATIVTLDSRGQSMDSHEFAAFVERLARVDKGEIAFVIGGKEGLGPASLRQGKYMLSLSQMTLPHRIARLFLMEQLYRAMTILRGEPYGL
jgi:23S rRNA (pseudouridine1915-N3)-methyltransferase